MKSADVTQSQTQEPLLRWAREQLMVPETCSREQLQAACLQQVEDEEFWPGSEVLCAYEILTQPEIGRDTLQAMRAMRVNHWETELAAQIEYFAQHFFSYSPEERRQRWERLQAECRQNPQLVVRLQDLSIGLVLPSEFPMSDISEMSVLAENLKRLFVLRRGPSTRLRQALLETWRAEAAHWQHITKQFERQHPDWAKLDERLLSTLKSGNRLPQPMRPPTTFSSSSVYSDDSQSENRWWVVLCIGCAVLGGLIAFLLDDGSKRSRQGQNVYPPRQVQPSRSLDLKPTPQPIIPSSPPMGGGYFPEPIRPQRIDPSIPNPGPTIPRPSVPNPQPNFGPPGPRFP